MLSAKEVAYAVTKALDSKKGMDIKLLKIDKISSLADYFLICTGTSSTHVKTLCDYAEYTLDELGEKLLGREGHRAIPGSFWITAPWWYTCLPRKQENFTVWNGCGPMPSKSTSAISSLKSERRNRYALRFYRH